MSKQRAMSDERRVLLSIFTIIMFFAFGCSSVQKIQEPEEDLGDAYTQMGGMFFVDNKLDIAMEQFQKALKEYVKKYGKRHPKVAATYFNIGTVHLVKGSLVDAKVYYNNAENICEDYSVDDICTWVIEKMKHNLRVAEERKVSG